MTQHLVTRRNCLCNFFVQCNSSPILQTKELKMGKKNKNLVKQIVGQLNILHCFFWREKLTLSPVPAAFPSSQVLWRRGKSTPRNAALDISVIKAVNFLLVKMSKHCSFHILSDEAQQPIIKSNIYSLSCLKVLAGMLKLAVTNLLLLVLYCTAADLL